MEPGWVFGAANWAVLVSYAIAVALIGWVARGREPGSDDYLLAQRQIPWWAAGLSIYATQQSALTFMTIPMIAFTGNWAVMLGNLTIVPASLVAAYWFVPVFRQLEIKSVYEYLEYRFDRQLRVFASILYILVQVLKLGIFLFLPALAFSTLVGTDIYLTIIVLGSVVVLYTSIGGVRSVVWTDVFQVVVMTGGAVVCVFYLLSATGGFDETLKVAIADDKLDMLVWDLDLRTNTVWAVGLGGFVTSLMSYTSEQNVVQRYLLTGSTKDAQRSCWLNALLVAPSALLFFGLGTCLYVFYQTVGKGTAPETLANLVPWFIFTKLPPGAAGVAIAGIFAASMSSMDSSINALVSTCWNDLRRPSKPSSGGLRDWYGTRGLTLLFGVLGILVAVSVAGLQLSDIFGGFIKVLGLFGSALAAIFTLGLMTTRTHAFGAKVGLFSGTLSAAIVLTFFDVAFYTPAIFGFVTSLVVAYSISFRKRNARCSAS